MAQVTIGSNELQNNISDLDAEVMIALLQRLAAGVNSVDGTQIASKGVGTANIADRAVGTLQLSTGLIYYDTLNGNCIWNTADNRIRSGTADARYTVVARDTNSIQLGGTNGITPQQNCYALLNLKVKMNVGPCYKRSDNSAMGTTLDVGQIWIDAYDSVTATALIEGASQIFPMGDGKTSTAYITIAGLAVLNAGQNYKLVPRFKWCLRDAGSLEGAREDYEANVTVYADAKHTQMSAILLPR